MPGHRNPQALQPSQARSGWTPGGARPAAPDPVAVLNRLTRRDRALLQLLSEHRVLTTGQITQLLAFPSLDRAQRRLLALFRWHVIERFRRPGLDGTMTSWRYTLGPNGAAVLAAMRGTPAPRPGVLRDRLLRLAANPRLDHLLGVNDLFAALAGHAHRTPGDDLTAWYGDLTATHLCGQLARPDGIGIWRHRTHQTVLCLEYDTGTESLTQVADKLHGYADLARAGGPKLPSPTGTATHTPAFWVLFHLHSLDRETHLRQRLDNTAPRPGSWGVATTSADYTRDHTPAGDIWLPATDRHRRTLAHLTTTTPLSTADGDVSFAE